MYAKPERKRAHAKKAHQHESVHEYFDEDLPDNLGSGRARQYLLERLNSIKPNILKSLAETCFRPELLNSSVDLHLDLLWGHIHRAAVGGAFKNFASLLAALVNWTKDEPQGRWNLCDQEGKPLDWIAEAAVQTLESWQRRGRLPEKLNWEGFDLCRVRLLDSEAANDMFVLERHFDAGQLSDREQRKAKKRYNSLGRELGLTRMRRVESRYFDWYAMRTFLGFTLQQIKECKDVNPGDPKDLSLISKGIAIVADLVDFRGDSRRKRTKNIQ